MAEDVRFNQRTVQAAADLTGAAVRFKAITLGGTIAAGPLQAAGILRTSTSSGSNASVGYEGEMKAQFGTAVSTVGFPLTITTSGFVVACASGGYAVGRSIATTASGDLAKALFDFKSLLYWAG